MAVLPVDAGRRSQDNTIRRQGVQMHLRQHFARSEAVTRVIQDSGPRANSDALCDDDAGGRRPAVLTRRHDTFFSSAASIDPCVANLNMVSGTSDAARNRLHRQ